MDEDSHARKQLNVRVTPIAKERFIRGCEFQGRTVSALVERSAAFMEAKTLETLSPGDRAKYLAKEIQPIRPRKPGASEDKIVVWTTLSLMLTVKSKRQLHRFCNYRGLSISEFLRRLAHSLERMILSKLSKEQRTAYLAGTLDPAPFFELWWGARVPLADLLNAAPGDEEKAA